LCGTPPGAAEGFSRTEAWATTRRGGVLGPVHLGSQDFYEEALDPQEGGCGQEEHHAEEDSST